MNPFTPDSPEALIGLLEGSLSPADASAVRARLIADPALRAEYDALRATDAALCDVADALPGGAPDLLAGVMARVVTSTADTDPAAARMIAALEGALAGDDADRFAETLSSDPDADREYEALRAIDADLAALGRAAAEAPLDAPVLADAVMARVRALEAPNVLPFPVGRVRRTARPAARVPLWGVVAVGMCLLIGAVAVLGLVRAGGGPDLPGRVPVARVAEPVGAAVPEAEATLALAEVEPMLPVEPAVESKPIADTATPPPPRRVTLEDALRARREAMFSDRDSLSRLAALASLTEEEAEALLAAEGVTVDALLGAAQFLSDEDARLLLTALIDKNPEDPYLRMALALRGEPDTMLDQAEAWQSLDPGNALPYYLQAQAHFAQGNAVDALAALAMANGLGMGGLYSDDAARQREHMLLARGHDTDTAAVLAAASGGYWEGQTIRALGDELLAQGRAYETAGDYESAEQVYDAIRLMGAQTAEGALYAQERHAGLSAQAQAIQALQQLYELLQMPESLAVLGSVAEELVNSLNTLDQQLGQINHAFQNNASNIANLAGFILTNGDLFIHLFK